MTDNLYYNTVTPYLLKVLKQLMAAKEFEKFRLVGGTSLSLQRGHRFSVDIDLFTDEKYGSLDFKAPDKYLRNNFPYVDTSNVDEAGMGRSYFIGESAEVSVKLDLFYTDEYITPILEVDKIRMASVEDIIAMKLEVIGNGGRKKDFWDIHELKEDYSFEKMLALYKKKYPYGHDPKLIRQQFSNFEIADEEPDPECLKKKTWEVIKLDMMDFVKGK
jgi:predicted nucleotidyltransferase component of viral defense system